MKKVLLVNGSPKKDGNTAHALNKVAEKLHAEGIETEMIHIGHKMIHGCIACGHCQTKEKGMCVFKDDPVNEFVDKFEECSGIILGSPTYYASIPGTMKSFLDRVFYINGSRPVNHLRHKVATSIAVVRRTGGQQVKDQLNYYLEYNEMFLVGSTYWNVVYGRTPGEVLKDAEGMNTMENLGQNFAYALKAFDGKTGPEKIKKEWMHFIRD